MSPRTQLFPRLIQVLPVLIAFTFHAVALGRWLLVGPALIGLVVAVFRNTAVVPTSRRWYLTAGTGLLAGLVVPSTSNVAGPLPQSVAGAIAGMAIAVAVLAMFGNKVTIAWAGGWAVLAMSGKHSISGQLNSILLAFLVASLVATASHAGLLRFRLRSLTTFGIFAVLTAVSTTGALLALKQVDRALLGTVETLMTKNPRSSITGLSNTITLGKQNQIKLSRQPLLELSEMSGVLRTKVMDNFDGHRWTTSLPLNSTSRSLDEILVRPEPPRELEMLFLDDLNNALPSPAGTFRVIGAAPRVTGGWIIRGEPEGGSVTMVGGGDHSLPVEPEPNAILTTVPDDLIEGLGPIAKELTDPSHTNRENAEAIATFFHQNFEYSLTTDLSGDDHPLVTRMQQRRPAYCVYFASAMAVMLRTQKIPARVVSGFVPGEVNRVTGRVTIRERDAHAWVEVWSPAQQRYFAFDPTPSGSRLQATGLDEPDRYLTSMIEAIRSAVRRIWLNARQDPVRMAGILVGSPYAWFALMVLFAWRVRKWRRPKTSPPRDRPDDVDPVLREIYHRYLGSLQRAGFIPQPWESDQDVIDRLAESGEASLSQAASKFIAKYRSMRFGGEGFDSDLAGLADLQSTGRT